MGNTTGKQLGNFQADVGRADASMSVIGAYFLAVILIFIAIGMAIMAFIPSPSPTCIPEDEPDKKCPKKKNYALLFGLLLIPLAVLIVYASKYWSNLVHHNKNVAIADGTMAEANWLSNLFNNNN